ncbi:MULTISPECIES: HesA/MoeB/ThiF family protein [unclassified Fusibacter]|uniref:HesA/MoeB/ThiF family protein n=1 Tax=unclassified Fusibacter TaxID=2624464 RepID=UPI0010125C2E|nr:MULTISPECIES: HesA/MoeB/ThiF family protein [unclassified Fusibacter]MCK8061135.1 HesA/MoeB/ThiF family protein [Fusibacter sp. A2]NPE23329.1 HesA/MoeB/ThiF family protein [Fusibacter sp. A1]RXV59372.1 HesA/MoeB/ThiF family protein [Fusibacter sp. A1]
MDRYDRNGIIKKIEQEKLNQSSVCIIGCGGLGGYVIEMLARFGIGNLTLVDGDVFNESNLNRQLLSTMQTLGKSKAFTASERVEVINPEIMVKVVATYVDQENVLDIIKGHDLIIDALDSNEIRQIVIDACRTLGLPYIYGAIAGWYGQVSTVFPEDRLVRDHLKQTKDKGIEIKVGNPSFTPATIASYQVSEAIKVLLNRGNLMREKILYVDLLENDFEIIS